MFQIPETFLNKLKCNLCDGYLNAKPVVVKDGKQICAKCYKILPHDEKQQCVRQITFEALGSCLVFPCRYHQMGCDYTFTWNNENGHETECKKRYFTFPDVIATNECVSDKSSISNLLDISDAANYIDIASTSRLDAEINAGNANAGFTIDVILGDQNKINEEKPQFTSTKPLFPALSECNNNSINSNSIYENLYYTIPSVSNDSINSQRCLSCNAHVNKSNKHLCLFGHISCNNCKSDMCVACVKNLDGNSRIACKNASKGCQELLFQSDVGFHRDNCEFNEITCPFDKCDKKCVLQQLIIHLKEDHANKIVLSNELTKTVGQKDQSIVILSYDGIFKCLYYSYITTAEIFVVYMGPCLKASEFYFEISVEVNKKTVRKKLMCANWNNYMLASGVTFDKKELDINQEKPLKFSLDLKILRA